MLAVKRQKLHQNVKRGIFDHARVLEILRADLRG